MEESPTAVQPSSTATSPDRQFASSIEIGKLSEALAKAQGQIEGAKKDASNPFFKSRYADLASVWDACREHLSKNGLAVVQLPGRNGGGMFVDTILSHSSGQWISSRLYITPKADDPQAIGSAITYGRRYGLQAIVGIAPEDDDAEAAMARQDKREKVSKTAKNAPVESDKQKWNGEDHKSLAGVLSGQGIAFPEFMQAMIDAKQIPPAAKSFMAMSNETAAKFIADIDATLDVVKSWKEAHAE